MSHDLKKKNWNDINLKIKCRLLDWLIKPLLGWSIVLNGSCMRSLLNNKYNVFYLKIIKIIYIYLILSYYIKITRKYLRKVLI